MQKILLTRCLQLTVLWMVLFFPGASVNAQVPLEQYNALRDVEVQQDEDGLRIRMEFKKPLKEIPHPTFFKRSVQMDFPLTYVDPPKRYFETGASVISQIYASQFDSELMRIRFMLEEPNSINASNFSVRTNGNVMNVDIRKSYADDLDVLLARATKKKNLKIEKTAPAKTVKPVADLAGMIDRAQERARQQSGKFPVAGNSQPDNGSTLLKKKGEPITLKKENKGSAQSFLGIKEGEADESGLWGTAITMMTTLAVVLGIMFLLFHLFKKFVWKNGVFGTEDKPIKVLSTGFLGPKKSIALVEVAGDILVLGISNDQISLLSNVKDEEKIKKLRNLENGKTVATKSINRKKGVSEKPISKPVSRKVEEDDDEIYSSKRRPNQFKDYVKRFSEPSKKENHSLNDVTKMIRSQLVKARVAQ